MKEMGTWIRSYTEDFEKLIWKTEGVCAGATRRMLIGKDDQL